MKDEQAVGLRLAAVVVGVVGGIVDVVGVDELCEGYERKLREKR